MTPPRSAMRAVCRSPASARRAAPAGVPLLLALGAAALASGAVAQDRSAAGSSTAAGTGTAGGSTATATGAGSTATATGTGSAAAATGTASTRLPIAIVPSVSLSQTVSRGDSRDRGDQRFDAVTQLSPAVSMTAGSRRLNGFLDYALNVRYEANGENGRDIRHALNSALKAELVDDRLFVDASANISQQLISALGQQYANDDALDRGNRSQVTSYTVTPYLRGAILDRVRYDARLSHTATHTGTALAGNSSGDSAQLRFTGGTAFSALSWGLTGSREVLDFDAGRRTTSDRVSVDLGYLVTPQFNVSARAGRESSDLVSLDKQTYTTWGVGAGWRPSPLTSASLNFERRAYGNTHAINLSHRTARTLWTFTDSRSVAAPDAQRSLGRLGTLGELLAATLPGYATMDAAQREAAVLAATGRSANTQVLAEFLNQAAISQRQQLLSVAWIGIRDSATLSASQSRSDRIDQLSSPFVQQSASNSIVQRGVSASVSHRLTPLSSLGLTTAHQRTRADAGTSATRLTTVDLGWNSQLGRRLGAALTGRYSTFSGNSQPYTEIAVTGTLSLRF